MQVVILADQPVAEGADSPDFERARKIMVDALAANDRAHAIEEDRGDAWKDFDTKNRHLLQLYLEYGGRPYVKVSVSGNQIKFRLLGTEMRCHSKKSEMRRLIEGNGYPPEIRAALYRRFGIRPTAKPRITPASSRRVCSRGKKHSAISSH